MTLVQNLRVAGGRYTKPNIYDDAADRINELEAALRQYWEAKTAAAMGAADAVAAKLLTAQETACECTELDARGGTGDMEIFCPKCGKVFRHADGVPTSKTSGKP